MASVLFLAILGGFHTLNAACSDEDSSSDCTTAGCFWNTGICKATECSSLYNCAAGCIYQPAVSASCRDDTGCANFTDSDSCSANSKCKMTAGTCDVSEAAKTKCAVSPDNETNCPGGCVKVSSIGCESQLRPPTCEYDARDSLTSCTLQTGCTWNGSECVGDPLLGCDGYDDTEISECNFKGDCKVSGSSCVFDLNSEFFIYCRGINITEETTECETHEYCQINGSECVDAEGYVGGNCDRYSTTVVKACSPVVSEGCTIEDGNCVPGYNEICEESADFCLSVGFCKLSDSQCVFDSNMCESRSIEPYTECEYKDNGACKIVISDGIKQCQAKSSAEYCSEKSTTDCEERGTYNCEVSGGGSCVPRVPVCNLDATGTFCDFSNPSVDSCLTVYGSSCENAVCSSEDTEAGCTSLNVSGDSAGCEWNATGTCAANISCTLITTLGTCSSTDDCTLIPAIAGSCSQDPAITDATCKVIGNSASCGASPGCEWSNAGGSCVEKSCSNSPSYALCCNGDDSCAYCTAGVRPDDCPCISSYALCCNNNDSCAYCTAGVRPDDCPCISSYAVCCNGTSDNSCTYCTTGVRPDDCPCITSYALCCNGTSDDSCSYCNAGVRPNDCPKSCNTNPSYALCCNDTNDTNDESCAYCAATSRPIDCPPLPSCNTQPSYALCCNDTSDESCAYCTATPRPIDCPPPSCITSPTYALCCSGGDSCAYCAAADPRPNDCPPITPSPDCSVTPDAAGCETETPSSAFNVIAAAALVLAVLFIGWF